MFRVWDLEVCLPILKTKDLSVDSAVVRVAYAALATAFTKHSLVKGAPTLYLGKGFLGRLQWQSI